MIAIITETMYKTILYFLVMVLALQSCANKKDILYFQDSKDHNVERIIYQNSKIQPNDILSILVTAPIPEAAIPYNVQTTGTGNFDIESLKLQGYLVSEEGTIDFPILGELMITEMASEEVEDFIAKQLSDNGHLKNATVNVRLLNAKVTILGEVMRPGTYSFTEQNITLPQALGYSGDLTILGKREDVLLIREENGFRTINHIDLTSADWFDGPYYYIKPNDLIVINPNKVKVKSAGFIGNAGIVLTIASLVLSSFVLISR